MREWELAAYKTVHEHGGAERLSQFLACRAGTLNNKVDPACDTHHLTIAEAIALQLNTNTRHIIQAEAQALGGTFVQLGEYPHVSDMVLLDAWAEHQASLGRTADAIRSSLEDGLITRSELREIRREMFEDFRLAMGLFARLEALCNQCEEASDD